MSHGNPTDRDIYRSLTTMASLAAASIQGMKRFDGQTFIVTGGAQGIGYGIALRLFKEGVRICLR